MNWPRKIASSLTSHRFAAPLALAVVTALAYGLSFWRLGFYWDDQPIAWIRYQLGAAATAHYFYDSRPVWALLFQWTGYLLPPIPALWQLFAMFWRWAGVSAFWLVMDRLFPQRKGLVFLLSLLVLLYPGFNQQWVGYLYAHFFIVLFFLLFSWHLMFRGKTIPAMILSALNLLMLEYFFLLEFVRPVLIFLSLRDEPLTNRERVTRTFKTWLPYAGVIVLAVLYRVLVYSHPGFGYSLTDEMAHAPLETLNQLARHVFSSLWVAAGEAWGQAFQFPAPQVNGLRTSIVYVIIVLAVAVLGYVFIRMDHGAARGRTRSDAFWMVGLGAILLLLGGAPYWMTNLPVTLGFPANRATLSFMFGACFLLLGLIEFLPTRFKYAAAILLISLSAGRQFLWSAEYVREWEAQKNLFWQMTWRAPGLEPGTLVLMNQALKYNADNSLSAALNWIYAPENHSGRADYLLFYPTNRIGHSLPRLEPGLPIQFDYVAAKFSGSTSQTIVFYYAPPACLRLLDPEIDAANRLIPGETLLRDAAVLSSTAPILKEQTGSMPGFYLPEPAHGWCYYFQKADLARQQGDWAEVVRLAEIAFGLGDHPNDPVERFVFIEGYAHVGEWARAQELSLDSYRVSKEYVAPMLCSLWTRIGQTTPHDDSQRRAVEAMREKFCASNGG